MVELTGHMDVLGVMYVLSVIDVMVGVAVLGGADILEGFGVTVGSGVFDGSDVIDDYGAVPRSGRKPVLGGPVGRVGDQRVMGSGRKPVPTQNSRSVRRAGSASHRGGNPRVPNAFAEHGRPFPGLGRLPFVAQSGSIPGRTG